MRWFEHQADAADNKKIRKIEAWGARLHPEYGAMGAVGWYFRLLEVIAGHGQFFRLPDDYGADLVAQDYLIKGQVTGRLLARSLRYARERHRTQELLRSLALMDDLTGLYNRRGFTALAEQQLRLAGRGRREFLLICADLDGMKLINDTFGHQEGDRALRETARILKQTFRESDIIARWGGDEFAVLVIDTAGDNLDTIAHRLQGNLDDFNARSAGLFQLSLSIGAARFQPKKPSPLKEMLAQADAALYAQKRKNSGNHNAS